MGWFVICNHLTSKAEMPKLIYDLSGQLQRVLFCCFPPSTKDDKTNEKNEVISENDQITKPEDQESTTSTSTQSLRRHNRVESISMQPQIFVSRMEFITTNPRNAEPIDTIADVSNNETNQKGEPKCDFCNRCESCQADKDKDKAKEKNKKDVEGRCNALNYLVFICVLLLMLVSNMVVWLLMSK